MRLLWSCAAVVSLGLCIPFVTAAEDEDAPLVVSIPIPVNGELEIGHNFTNATAVRIPAVTVPALTFPFPPGLDLAAAINPGFASALSFSQPPVDYTWLDNPGELVVALASSPNPGARIVGLNVGRHDLTNPTAAAPEPPEEAKSEANSGTTR